MRHGLHQTMRGWRRLAPAAWLLMALGLACGPALAHKGSDAYLEVQQVEASAGQPASQAAGAGMPDSREFRLTLAVAVRDLDLVVPMDANADARVTWGETKAATPQVLALLDSVANLQPPGNPPQPACRLAWQADGLERRSDGVYFRAVAQTRCPASAGLDFYYSLLKEQDSTHRLLVAGRIGGKDFLSTMSPQQGRLLLSPPSESPNAAAGSNAQAQNRSSSGRWSALRDYFSLGMHHLLEGYDHLAFLLALVLPLQLSLRRRPAALGASGSDFSSGAMRSALAGPTGGGYASRATWMALLRTVTAFTIGHSITLMLATFGLTQASPRWVEPAIALSIAFTALLNLRPVRWIRMDALALLFGLVHGFGFAGLLLEAAAPGGLLPWALAGFNLGVEAGQLTAVFGWVVLSQALVGRAWYGSVVVRGGSVLLMLLAGWWFWQRVA